MNSKSVFHTKNVCANLGEHKQYILWFRLIINIFLNSLSVVPYLDDADLQLKYFIKYVCLSLCGYLGFSFARWSVTLLTTYFFVRLFTFYQIILTFDVFKPSTWLLSVLQIAWRSLPQQPCNLQMTKPHQGHLSNIFLCTPQGWRSLQQQPCNLQMTKPHQGHFHIIFYIPSQGWRSLLQQPCNL